MNKIKVKIINGFRKTSSFGWRFVPKWKREFIKNNGSGLFKNIFEFALIKNEDRRKQILEDLKDDGLVPENTQESDVFKFHNGLDFVGSDNKLLAIADGVIMKVAKSDLSGNYIKVLYKFNNVEYLLSYCHLKTHTPDIKNDTVKKNEWIAQMGKSGVTSTGVHCHLTVRQNGEIIDPETIFEFI